MFAGGSRPDGGEDGDGENGSPREEPADGEPDGNEGRLFLPSGRELETLRVSHDEARTVLDHQIQMLSDIDDKAMRTVRITLLTLGILLSIATFPTGVEFVNWLTVSGFGLLVASLLLGLWTYSSSDPEFGLSASHLREIRKTPYTEEEWREFLLAEYEDWTSDMEELNQGNARLFWATQICVGLGVLLLAAGVLFGFLGWIEPVEPASNLVNATGK